MTNDKVVLYLSEKQLLELIHRTNDRNTKQKLKDEYKRINAWKYKDIDSIMR